MPCCLFAASAIFTARYAAFAMLARHTASGHAFDAAATLMIFSHCAAMSSPTPCY